MRAKVNAFSKLYDISMTYDIFFYIMNMNYKVDINI